VLVTENGRTPALCTPVTTGAPGCTVVAVPPPTPAVPQNVTNTVVPPVVRVPSAVPTP
jgi:hypothetical protein